MLGQLIVLLIVSFFSRFVFGQDPTEICQPEQIQINYYNFLNNTNGVYSVDFTKNIAAKYETLSKIRTVYDFKTLIAYVISPTGNCSKHGMSFTEFISKCLPATARKVSPDNTYLGFSPQVINVQTWQLDLADNVTLRTALTLGTSPVFPIVRQILDTVTGSPQSLIIFTDTVTRVDTSQFIIPPSCSTF